MKKHILVVGLGFNKAVLIALLNRILEGGDKLSFVDYDRPFSPFKFSDLELNSKSFEYLRLDEPTDKISMRRMLRSLDQNQPIDAVISLDHFVITQLAILCRELDIRYIDPDAARLCEDKLAMQIHLRDSGLPYNKVYDVADLSRIEKHCFPLILKPCGGVASIHIGKLNSSRELENVLAEFNRTQILADTALGKNPSYMLEEYLEGILLSAECIATETEFCVLAISQRQRADFNEAVELGSLIPSCLSESDQRHIEDFAAALCRTINFRCGICHIEIMFGDKGIRLLDFNPRLPGVGIPRMMEQAYGIDLIQALIDSHSNQPLSSFRKEAKCFMMNRLLGAHEPCQIIIPWTRKTFPNGAEVIVNRQGVLPKCSTNLDYFGEVSCTAESAEMCLEKMETIMPLLETELKIHLLKWSNVDRDLWKRFSQSKA